jgi:RND family efflux transporter MFP subunit
MPDRRQLAIAAGVLAVGLLLAGLLVATPKRAERGTPEPLLPVVETLRVELRDVALHVRTHGTVVPRTESDLVPEVSGRVVWVSPALAAGGAFEAEEVLLRIDAADYEIALKQAKANVAQARSEARRASAELERVRRLASSHAASASQLEDAENAGRIARAALLRAEAALERAQLDLGRTELRAPYRGRVRSEQVDVGQFAARGQPVGRIYAIDFAEVRLPIRDEEIRRLPAGLLRGAQGAAPRVTLTADFAGARHRWEGLVMRVEGEIDPRTRMIYAVARVDDPYGAAPAAAAELGADDSAPRPPLAPGLFVEAEIAGRRVRGAAVIPRAALHEGNRVWVVDAEGQLQGRALEIAQTERTQVVATGGLRSGERVCITPIAGASEGMRVNAREARPLLSSARAREPS